MRRPLLGRFCRLGYADFIPRQSVWRCSALYPVYPIPQCCCAWGASREGGEIERHYVAWFQLPDVAESYMDQRVPAILSKIMRTAPPREEVYAAAFADGKININPFLPIEEAPVLGDPLLDQEAYERYVAAFTRTGFGGGINWYRNIDNNAEAHPDVGVIPLSPPFPILKADRDPVLRPEFAADMPERCSCYLEIQLIEYAGHWVQRGQADVVNSHLCYWLQRHFQ